MLTCFGVERETAARPSRSNGSTEVSALGGEALLAIKGISPGKDPSQVARTLLMEHGAEKALKTAARERAQARRARSRKRFNYWIAISEEITAMGAVEVNSQPR